ncbi:MAG: iron transporter [Actinobacteria bacterium]|nr:iron transporter [Actinomycetota bacterium]
MRARFLAAALVAVLVWVSACADGRGQQPAKRSPATAQSGKVPEGVATQYATIEEEVHAEGGEKRTGPWRIAYIVEPAEGWFERRGDDFEWRAPAEGETHHIEILPIEAETGRLVPEVPITVEVLDAQGERVARKSLTPYYAEFFHYAENFSIPEARDYTLRAEIEPPDLRRHGEEQGDPALADGAEVEFENVRLEPEEGS